MWDLERNLLREILRDRTFQSHLDFACGTGRILAECKARSVESTGLDVSHAMVSLAREKCSEATLFVADFRENPSILEGRRFDLITAFRFFPNAQPELREEALRFLASHLSEGGLLVLNNHRNLDSTSFRIARFLRKSFGKTGMRDSEVIELIHSAGLNVVLRRGLGAIPQTEARSALPWALTRRLELALAKATFLMPSLGYNVIYVARRPIGT